MLGREIGELGKPFEEGELLGSDRPIAVLGEDDLREPLVVGLLVVVLVAVEEHDEVGVLLDRSRFTQIRERRPFVGSALDCA